MTLSVLQRIAVRCLRLLGRLRRKKPKEYSGSDHNISVRAAKKAALNRCVNEPVENSLRETLYQGRFVTDQRKLAAMKLGKSDMGYAGCELISVYNALGILESTPTLSLTELISEAETKGLLVRKGKWGTNPFLLDRLASVTGLTFTKVFNITDAAKMPGVYIASFWNDRKLMSGVHTVCFKVTADEIIIYNYRYADKPYSISRDGEMNEKLFAGKPVFLVYSIAAKSPQK